MKRMIARMQKTKKREERRRKDRGRVEKVQEWIADSEERLEACPHSCSLTVRVCVRGRVSDVSVCERCCVCQGRSEFCDVDKKFPRGQRKEIEIGVAGLGAHCLGRGKGDKGQWRRARSVNTGLCVHNTEFDGVWDKLLTIDYKA